MYFVAELSGCVDIGMYDYVVAVVGVVASPM